MNGVEFITRLRKQHPTMSIILISGFTDTLGLNEANTGADVVIQKSSHEVSHLVRSVNRLLRKGQQPVRKPAASQVGKEKVATAGAALVFPLFGSSFVPLIGSGFAPEDTTYSELKNRLE